MITHHRIVLPVTTSSTACHPSSFRYLYGLDLSIKVAVCLELFKLLRLDVFEEILF
jgi:hypothetical protein